MPPAAPTDETVARELEAIRAALKDRRDAYDSREAVLLQLTLIDGYATKVLAAEAREGAAVKRFAGSVKKELAAFQAREFRGCGARGPKPPARRYGRTMSPPRSAAARAETVEFVDGLFAANANIKRTQESLREALTRLRVKADELPMDSDLQHDARPQGLRSRLIAVTFNSR